MHRRAPRDRNEATMNIERTPQMLAIKVVGTSSTYQAACMEMSRGG